MAVAGSRCELGKARGRVTSAWKLHLYEFPFVLRSWNEFENENAAGDSVAYQCSWWRLMKKMPGACCDSSLATTCVFFRVWVGQGALCMCEPF